MTLKSTDDKTISETNAIQNAILENPWRNAYWFSRMLINGDKYGAIGKESKLLAEISLALHKVIDDKKQQDELKVELSKQIIKDLFNQRFSRLTGKTYRINLFFEDISKKLQTMRDVFVFVLVAESILIPINKALEGIPNDDKQYTEAVAKAYLDKLGDCALATVIGFWDDAGVEGCL